MYADGLRKAGIVLALATAPAAVTVTAAAATPASTTLSIRAAHSAVRPHTKDTISGTLRSSGKRLAGQKVTLEQRQAGTKKWSAAATATTGSAGGVSFSVVPAHQREQYELRFAGTAAYAASHSAVVTVTVKNGTSLSITAAHTTVKPHKSDTISGALRSGGTGLTGMTVSLRERKSGTVKWSTVQSGSTGTGGRISFSVVPPNSKEQYELVFAGTARYFGSHSGVVTVTVA